MKTGAAHRLHAAKVAAVATLIVLAAYLIAIVVLNLLVVHRLTGQADLRLAETLTGARREVLHGASPAASPMHHERDVDDAPAFVWRVAPTGAVTSLTSGAPALPGHHWDPTAVTLNAGGSPFRFQATRSGSGWLVAGASIGQIKRVQSALVVPEVLVGSVLMVLAFGGALVIGLRASAPLEVVRLRQSEFTADASHELRTPLSVIEAEVDLALSRPRGGAAYQAVLERVSDESRRLRSIVDDLLWLARADGQDYRVSGTDEVDLAVTAEACVDRFQAVALSRAITLRFVRSGTEPTVLHADAGWIDRLIGVLVDNALLYAGPGGVAEVRVGTNGSRILLAVDDSGPGIPAEHRAAIFDRFHRGSDEPGGTGLGLAIADSVVRATGGTWSVKTAPMGGASMEVSWRRGGSRQRSQRRWGSRAFARPRTETRGSPSSVDPEQQAVSG